MTPFLRPRPARIVATLAATLLLVVGCGSGDGSDAGNESASGNAADPVALGDTVTLPVPPTELTVLDAGAEPRTTLGGPLPDDATSRVPAFSSVDVYQTIDDEPEQNFSSPAVTFDLSATAADDHTIDMRIHNPSSPEPGLADMIGAAEGAEVSVTVDDRRAISELRITPTADSSDTVRATVEQAIYQIVYRTVAVPDEPVGVGARWQFTQSIDGTLILSQTTTATVREIDGSTAVIDLVIEQRPTSDIWTLPQDAGTLHIDTYTTSGTGSVTLDTRQPLPTAGHISLQGEQVFSDPNSTTRLQQRTGNVLRYGA